MRYAVGVACIALVIARAVWAELRFDTVSLVLFIVGAIVLLFPELRDLVSRVKRIRVGEFEVELAERLKDLAAKTESVEAGISEKPAIEGVYPQISDEVVGQLAQAATDPRAALLLVAIEIERTLRKISEETGILDSRRTRSVRRLVGLLSEKGVIDSSIVPVFSDFWSIRNQVVHGYHFELSPGKLYELVELGLRILRLISRKGTPQKG